MRHAICYVSNKNKEMSINQVEELLQLCSTNNNSAGIKGLLLYSEGNFFQVIEGEKVTVMNLFEKIKQDPRHHGIIQVVGRDINRTLFDGYETDIIDDEMKYLTKLPKEYTNTLEGIPLELKNSLKRMLGNFIDTR